MNYLKQILKLSSCFSADELISDSDRENMKKNHEFFTRMCNVSEILLRLFTRGVIADLAHDRLSGAEHKAGTCLFIWGLTSLSTLYRSYHDG